MLGYPFLLKDRIMNRIAKPLGKVTQVMTQGDSVVVMSYDLYEDQGLVVYWNPQCVAIFTKEEWDDDSVGTYG